MNHKSFTSANSHTSAGSPNGKSPGGFFAQIRSNLVENWGGIFSFAGMLFDSATSSRTRWVAFVTLLYFIRRATADDDLPSAVYFIADVLTVAWAVAAMSADFEAHRKRR